MLQQKAHPKVTMAPRLSLIENVPELADSQSFCFEKDDQPIRRTVSFAISEHILFYEESSSSCCDKENRWYSKLETDQFKKENSRSAQAIVLGKHRHIADLCERGLENVTKAGALQSKNRRKVALKAVMDEQRRQREISIYDPEAIAQAYGRLTSRSCLAAAAQGHSDSLAVDCYRQDLVIGDKMYI